MGCAKARLPCAAFVVRAWAQGGQACRADRVLHRGGRIGGAVPSRRVPTHAGRPRAGRKALARLVRDVANVRGKRSLARLYRGDCAARFTDTGGIGRMTTPSKVYVPEPGTRVRVLEICPSDYSARLQVGDVITVSWSRVGRGSGNGYALVGIDSGELGTWCLVEPAPTSPARCDTICPDGRRCELHGHHDRCMTSTKMTLHGSWAAASPAREDVCDACGATPVTHRDTIAKDFQPTDLTDRYNFCKACSVVHWDKLIPAIRTRRRSLTQPAEEFRVGDECEGNHKGEIRSGILVNFEPLANGIAGAWLTQPGEPTTGLLWGVHRNSLRLIRRASQGFKKG